MYMCACVSACVQEGTHAHSDMCTQKHVVSQMGAKPQLQATHKH